jgi:hypothetical protein
VETQRDDGASDFGSVELLLRRRGPGLLAGAAVSGSPLLPVVQRKTVLQPLESVTRVGVQQMRRRSVHNGYARCCRVMQVARRCTSATRSKNTKNKGASKTVEEVGERQTCHSLRFV